MANAADWAPSAAAASKLQKNQCAAGHAGLLPGSADSTAALHGRNLDLNQIDPPNRKWIVLEGARMRPNTNDKR